MEASVAAQGGQATTTGAQGAGGDGANAQAGGDAAPQWAVGVQESQQEMRQVLAELQQNMQAQVAAPGQGADDGAAAGDDAGVSAAEFDFGFLEDEAIAGDPTALKGAFGDMLKEALTPIVANQQHIVGELAKDRQNAQWDELTTRYPDLEDEAVYKPIMATAELLVAAKGWDKSLARDPKMLELVYLGERAIAQSQTEEDGQHVATAMVEGGGGARQATAQQTTDIENQLGDAIVGGRNGRPGMPFG